MDPRADRTDRRGRAALHARLSLLYLAAGMPSTIVGEAVPQYLRRAGATLVDVGRIPAHASWAWVLKFLWAPWVDRTRRRPWIVGALAALAALLASFALGLSGAGPWVVGAAVFGVALASATLDLGVDGWTIDRVPPRDLGPANAVRTSAYRIGAAVGGGVLAKVAGGWSWPAAWGAAAVAFALFGVASSTLREDPRERPRGPPLLPAALDLARRRAFLPVALFVVLFKVGDYALASMAKAFQVDAGLSDDEIGNLALAGMGATIAGVAVGGLVTKRLGPFAAMAWLGLLQAGSNLAYAAAAAAPERRALLYAAPVVEQLCGGLGTAPFVSFLMSACARAHAATQFALLTALMALGRIGAGHVAGGAAQAWGYSTYFLATAAAALPAYGLLPWVRRFPTARVTEADDPGAREATPPAPG